MRPVRWLGLLLVSLAAGTSRAAAPPDGAPKRPACGSSAAIGGVLDEFANHRLVLLGEHHQRKEFHDFLRALIRDRRFAERVNDVAVEFGNARLQATMDRFIAGADVAPGELEACWRDTTQAQLVWDSPLYEEFFRALREVNRGLPADRKIRVLLGDPPIDWSSVRNAAEYGRFADRDAVFADVVETEVLARGRSALVVAGTEHVLLTPAGDPLPKHPGVGDLLVRKHRRMISVIDTVPAKRPLSGYEDCFPLLLPISGEVGDRSFAELVQPGLKVQRVVDGKTVWLPMEEVQWPRVRERLDALLWLGPEETVVPPRPDTLTRAYLIEVHRRVKIMSDFFGFDLTEDLPPVPPK